MSIREAFVKDFTRKAVEVVKAGKLVVLVGVRRGNIQPELEDHKSIVAWQADGGLARKTVPLNTGLLLCTRFGGHADWGKFQQAAKGLGAYVCTQALQTGELRRILDPIVNLKPVVPQLVKPNGQHVPLPSAEEVDAPVEPTVADRTRTMVKKGMLVEFVRSFANLDATVLAEEARRLFPEAKELGIDTTLSSLEQCIRTERMRRKIAKPDAPNQFTGLSEQLAAAATVVAPPVDIPPVIVSPRPENLAVKAIDDAIAAAELALQAAQSARARLLDMLGRQEKSEELKRQLLALADQL